MTPTSGPYSALASSSDFSSTPPTSSASMVPVALDASATTLPILAGRSPVTTFTLMPYLASKSLAAVRQNSSPHQA